MSNPPSSPSADALEAAKERLTRVVQGDALRDVYPRGTQPSDFHADIRTLFSALGSDGEDSKRLIPVRYEIADSRNKPWRDAHFIEARAQADGSRLWGVSNVPGDWHLVRRAFGTPAEALAAYDAALAARRDTYPVIPGDANGHA